MSTFPSRGQYQAAVQNPAIAFRDAALRDCAAECDAQGMPRTYSGGFATTFRMSGNGAAWAVRCFTSPVAQLATRYGIISSYLANVRPDFLVSAALLTDGIRVGAVWHPVITMQWLSGHTLNSYIEGQLQATSQLIRLRDNLVALAHEMQQRDMAHGDLQHGNVIVSLGRLRLVDYDGIYVPKLRGMPPAEIGHKNFQHPQRSQAHWGPTMDRFSLILLYIGLSALALQPTLWNDFNNGENVLFTRRDFAEPNISDLFQQLRSMAQIANMAERFQKVCAEPLEAVPNLQDFISGQGTYTLANGDTYTGAWQGGGRNGQGTTTYPNGDTYTGNWRDDKRNGQGTYTFANGDTYTGAWQGGGRNGQGTQTFASGARYTGNWKDDKRNGQGTYTFAKGYTYTGNWKDNKRNGQGTYTLANGDTYTGEWQGGGRNGQGTHTFANGEKYSGRWKDGERNGQGTYTFANGDTYTGAWQGGGRNGLGAMTFANGDAYAGQFKDGRFKGQGTWTSANGNKYTGQFKDDEFNGQGNLAFADGDAYTGQFKDDKFNGQGTWTFADGREYSGGWKDGYLERYS